MCTVIAKSATYNTAAHAKVEDSVRAMTMEGGKENPTGNLLTIESLSRGVEYVSPGDPMDHTQPLRDATRLLNLDRHNRGANLIPR